MNGGMMRGNKYTQGQIDRWITGNYGEDHPDNQESYCPTCDEVISQEDYEADKCSNCGKEVGGE